MKNKWLNLVLLLTNRIYNRKQLVISQAGPGVIYNIIVLIFSEIVLGIISFPLYLGLKPEKVMAFMSEKGTYAKVSFDYNLRRILTTTGVGIFALIWIIKLALILLLPSIHGPMQLYSVSNFNPKDILSKDLVANEIGIQTARVVDTMPRPELTIVKKVKGVNYDFIGKGQPNSMVVLLLSDQQTAVYTTDVDKNGEWHISHQQSIFHLKEGNHSVIIFGYNKELGIRSEAAQEQFFKVTTSWLDSLIKNVDILANWSIVIIILLGVFLTLLTI
ncbi:MAG: hypothetical protein PHG83_02920 [Patescibacteria group bacterium]|jgi:hypothetical protein|nr:hypothetical protein [Patescibacteria group bacterium]